MSSIAPGWYKDPADPATQRYWDGEGWVGAALPADAVPPPGPLPAPAPVQPAAVQPGPPAPVQPAGVRPGPPGTGPGVPPGAPPPRGVHRPYAYPMPLPAARPHGLPLATPGARLVARLIDIAVLLLLTGAVNAYFVWQWWQEVAPTLHEVARRFGEGSTSSEPLAVSGRANLLEVAIVVIAAALWLAYEVPALADSGQTFGKRVLGIKVVRLESDEPLGVERALRRWTTLGMPTLLWPCYGLGFVLQFVDCLLVLTDRPLRQALHDKRAVTAVVQVAGRKVSVRRAP